jgi:hypothetical protein
LDKDYSHLHIESTDKIYPKIKKYLYDYDLSKTDPILDEFNYFYELEDWDEALNKGFVLLNLFETNPNAKIQTINLCLFLAEIFIKQEKHDNASKLLGKAEKKLDLKFFKQLQEEGLYYKYIVKLRLLKGIVALKTQKDKVGIILLKEGLEIIENQKLLEQQQINISISSDYLNILLLQAKIYLKNKLNDKYNQKITESLEFFGKLTYSNFSLEAKRILINDILLYCEGIKNNSEIDNTKNLAAEGLKAIENLIPEIKNSKTRDEFHLRFNILWMALQAKKPTIDAKSFFKKMEMFTDIINKLDLDAKVIESAKLEIFNLKDTLCMKNLQNIENQNDYDPEVHKILLNNQFEILKILKNNIHNYNNHMIADENIISLHLLNFFESYSQIKNYKITERIKQIISFSQNFTWDAKITKDFIENLNYNFLYLKNVKIIENLNKVNQVISNETNDENTVSNDFDKFNQEKNYQKIKELKILKEIDFNEIANITNFIQREKKKSENFAKINFKSLNKISKFMQKEISLLIQNNKNKQENKLDCLILKCLLFNNFNSKNLKSIHKLNKIVEKFFILNNKNKIKPTEKLNRNMNLSDIQIKLFNLTEVIKGEFNSDPEIYIKANLLDNYKEYSTEEIRKIIISVFTLANCYFKIADENYMKLFLLFNEKTFDENNYFKNMFVIRHNIAHKRINFFSNFSIQLIQIIFSTKNNFVKSFIQSNDPKNIELVSEIKKLIANNFITKCYTALYFSNVDLNQLCNLIKENKSFLDDFLADGDQNKFEIQNELERLEDILDKNINLEN